jgi:threonine/homoserine/homoserine lactone efflux protein
MPDSTHFALFLTAALLLAIAPGPGMLYVLARCLAGGRREGILSAIGTFFGGMVHVLAAAAGVSIILAKSALAFATVKYVGAAYLCFLGLRMILDARREHDSLSSFPASPVLSADNADAPQAVSQHSSPTLAARSSLSAKVLAMRRNPLWQGVTTEVLNPKTALFFLSFIPQFVDRTAGHVFLQFFVLGTISVCLNTSADLIVTALAGPLGNRIRSSATFRRRQRTATGVIMIGLGTYLAGSESH